MLEEVVGLRDTQTHALLPEPTTTRTAAGRGFLQLLGHTATAFEEVSLARDASFAMPTCLALLDVFQGPVLDHHGMLRLWPS